jgi:murein DD-endopeptidase MepM/ murein hydrolase activator NlpD
MNYNKCNFFNEVIAMKKYLVIILAAVLLLGADRDYKSQKQKNRDMLNLQISSDKEKKDALLRKMKLFISEINGRLGDDSKTKIDIPIDTNKMTDLKKTEAIHSSKKIPERVFAFVNDDNVRFRSEPNISSAVIDRLNYSEKIEILIKSKEQDIIEGMKSSWFFIRRESENEGWVFGAFIQKNKPDKKQSIEKVKPDKNKGDKIVINDGQFGVPVIGTRSSNFGYRAHPVTKKAQNFHQGVDIAAPKGTSVKASADGIVRIAGWNNNGYGNLIVVEHEKDLTTYYGHLETVLTSPGTKVTKGQEIGTVDSTGMSTGNHLHFEIRKSGNALDPDEFMR